MIKNTALLIALAVSTAATQSALQAAPQAITAPSMDALLANPELWKMSRAQFEAQAQPLGFGWVSAARNTAQTTAPVTLFQLPTYQSVVRFDTERLKEFTVLFYNRGDAGEIEKTEFEAVLKKTADGLTTFTKAKMTVRGKDQSSAVHAEGLEWKTADASYLLEYSFTRENKAAHTPYRAEFVRLMIHPMQPTGNLVATAIAAREKTKFSGPAHVKKDASGDVRIDDVPMVDQGQKGYCVVATAERVIRYYGGKADEHELAEIANSSASGGTSVEAMIDSLKKLSNRLRVRVRTIEGFDVPQIQRLVAEYNRQAKRGKRAPEIPLGAVLDVQAIFTAMDTDVLRDARTKNPSDLTKFQRNVQAHIDQGIPLLWSVMLGKVPEKDIPQNAGGHMRLIIGYNAKTNEIFYTDSWGAGHELKRMPAADAWTMTTGVYSIEPLSS